MPKKAILTAAAIVAAIQANNAAFEAMPREQKRIIVAQDTIFQLWSGKYEAKSGDYFLVDAPDGQTFTKGEEIQTIINTPGLTCSVCARGAIFASAVRLTDKLKVNESTSYLDMGSCNSAFRSKETKFFPRKQLVLMEQAFEVDFDESITDIRENYEGDELEALLFGRRYQDDTKRLMAIMQNVIEHNGTFIPSIKTKPLTKKEFYARHQPYAFVAA